MVSSHRGEEPEAIRAKVGPDLIIVTPGIRPTGTGTDDHARATTPTQTIAAGADYLVVGRPIETHKIRRLRRQRFWPKCRQPSIAGLDSKSREFHSPAPHPRCIIPSSGGRLRLFFAVCCDARSLKHLVWWV